MQPVKTKKKLSRADKKQIEAAIARANRTDKKGKSAQDSIPYERMWPDGICRVSDSHYTKTIQFQDINYQLSQNEDKTAIFEGWCDFLNYFDSSIHFRFFPTDNPDCLNRLRSGRHTLCFHAKSKHKVIYLPIF